MHGLPGAAGFRRPQVIAGLRLGQAVARPGWTGRCWCTRLASGDEDGTWT